MTELNHIFDPSILREYDVRGLVGKTLTEKDAYAVGRAFGSLIKRQGGKKVGFCYDGRTSSPSFAKELSRALVECGLTVEIYGVAPTPLAYYALNERGLDGALAITGSHNPPEYNGIKMALKSGPVYGEAIKQLGETAAKGDFVSEAGGTSTDVDLYEAYIDRLVSDYQAYGKKPMTIVWDAGNGAVGAILKRLTDKLPGTHILLFDDVDGNFPNHHPDPAVEKNLEDLKKSVLQNNADLGIAFDGDGDRIGAVDAKGTVIWSDQLIALYAKDILERQPGATIIIDVKCSKTVYDMIENLGGKPIIWKAGHSLVKAKMMETKAALGGELSGHIFFKEGFYGHDDAVYCAIRLLNVVNKYGTLTELHSVFPTVYNTPEIRFDVPEEDKFAIIERSKIYVENTDHPDTDVLDIDGIRVSTPQGWWLLRASNTQNALTARAESTSQEGLDDLVESLKHTLKAAGCDYPDPLY